LGQPVIIENVGGAGGSIGVGRAAIAASISLIESFNNFARGVPGRGNALPRGRADYRRLVLPARKHGEGGHDPDGSPLWQPGQRDASPALLRGRCALFDLDKLDRLATGAF